MRDHRNVLAARLAVAMNAAIMCYLLVTIDWPGRPLPIGFVLALGAGATPALFWMFAKAWFNDERELRKRDLALVAACAINTAILQITYPSDGWINVVTAINFRVAMLVFAGAALLLVWRGRDGDLVEGRRRLRTRLVIAVSLYVVAITVTEVAVQYRWLALGHAVLLGTLAVCVIFAFCAAMFGMRQADLFGSPTVDQKKPRVQNGEDDPLADKLLAHMLTEMPHRDETLSIARLAAQLGEQEYRLRRAINQQLGHRNFASFLNGYRLEEAKAALADPTQKEVPIITIALDAGFGSLGPFNRGFREAEAMTPSEFGAGNAG